MMKINVLVKPNSKKGPLVEKLGDRLVVYIREPAIDGKANDALIKILAKHYKVSKSSIAIQSGLQGRQKIIDVKL